MIPVFQSGRTYRSSILTVGAKTTSTESVMPPRLGPAPALCGVDDVLKVCALGCEPVVRTDRLALCVDATDLGRRPKKLRNGPFGEPASAASSDLLGEFDQLWCTATRFYCPAGQFGQ